MDEYYFEDYFNEYPISGEFGELRGDKYHYGIDYAIPYGTSLPSISDGEVLRTGCSSAGYGKYVIVDNGDSGVLYGHLSEINVKEGDKVAKGDVVGKSGNGDGRYKAHLHLEAIDLNKKMPDGKTIRDKFNNGKTNDLDKNGCKAIGVRGKEGRYNPYTGKDRHDNDISDKTFPPKDNTNHTYNIPKYTRDNLPTALYIWHTSGDDKVRSEHKEKEGKVFSIDEEEFPGEAYNCRCYAEPITNEEYLDMMEDIEDKIRNQLHLNNDNFRWFD